MRLVIILILLCFGDIAVLAKVQAVEAGPGLPDKYINDICKDARGLMWVATRQGLCSYDGNRFESMGSALPAGAPVTKMIYNPARKEIFLASGKGVYLLRCPDRSTRFIGNGAAWCENAVTEISQSPDGSEIYAAYTSGEIAVINNAGQIRLLTRIQQVPERPGFANSIEPLRQGKLKYKVEGKGTWYEMSLSNGNVSTMPMRNGPPVIFQAKRGDTSLTEDVGSGLIISRDREAELFPALAQRLHTMRGVTEVLFTRNNSFYILCKQAKLYYVDVVANTIDTIHSDIFNQKLGTCLYRDPEGILWLGTNKGLIKITNEKRLFTPLLDQSPTISVRAIAEDEAGNIYAGTYSGVYFFSQQTKQWSKISTEIAYAILNQPGKYLYMVWEQFGLCRINKQTRQIECNFTGKDSILKNENRRAFCLTADGRGNIWIGTSAGLLVFNSSNNTIETFTTPGLPSSGSIVNITNASNGHLWLSTRQGIFELDPRSGVVWTINRQTIPALSSNAVNHVSEDIFGRLWVATVGGGINIVSADRHHVTVLKTDAGLSDNEVYQVLWQKDRRAWISTFNGLSTYSLQSNSFYNFYLEDGLVSNEFNHNSFLQESSGRILLGSISGIISFYPDSVFDRDQASRLFVSSISKWDNKAYKAVSLNAADTASTIVLKPLDHSLTFNLALSNYYYPEAEIFQYRIKGLFDEWVSLTSQPTLRLDGLAPGNYILEIKATDSRGAPALNTLRYHIQVDAFFFKSWWFYLLLFLLSSVLLGSFFFLRLQHIKRVQHLREQIASDLHDEVGSLLTRITMTSDNLQYSRNTEAERSGKLQKIASLSRNAASSMSDILWAIDARNDYTGNLADRMREHAEEMLSPLGVYPHFDFKVNQRMSIPSQLRQQLYLIYKEAINNIVKHSHPQMVEISYQHDERGFFLSIVNDGPVDKERLSTKGQGMKNIHMRAKKIHANAIAEREQGLFRVVIKDR